MIKFNPAPGDLFCVESFGDDNRFIQNTFLCVTAEKLRDGVINVHAVILIKDPFVKEMTMPEEVDGKTETFIFTQDDWLFHQYEGDFRVVARSPKKELSEDDEFFENNV